MIPQQAILGVVTAQQWLRDLQESRLRRAVAGRLAQRSQLEVQVPDQVGGVSMRICMSVCSHARDNCLSEVDSQDKLGREGTSGSGAGTWRLRLDYHSAEVPTFASRSVNSRFEFPRYAPM